MSPPFVRPEDLPMSPPQSLPPSPPAFAHPSFGPRTTHMFPSTPGASSADLNAAFIGSLDAGEEQPFRFPVPDGHLAATSSSSSVEHHGAGDASAADESTLPPSSQPAASAASGRKGVFRQAFLPATMSSRSSSAAGTHGRTASHGRSSSTAALRKSAESSGTGWRTHSPPESLLGLSGLVDLGGGKRRKSSVGESDAAPWLHRRALLFTVSRRVKRLLALTCLIVLALFLVKLSWTGGESTVTGTSKRLRKAPTPAALQGRQGIATRSSSTTSASRAGPETLLDWTWHEGEELAALIGFLTSEDTHAIPPMADGSKIDPELVLDFDPLHSANLASDMLEMKSHVWQERPIVLLGRGHGDPRTRDVRNTLLGLRTRPAPSVLLIDTRADADQIVPVLERLTGTPLDDFPVLLIGGRQVDPSLWHSAELKRLVTGAGATIIPPKMKRPVPANPNHKR